MEPHGVIDSVVVAGNKQRNEENIRNEGEKERCEPEHENVNTSINN